jgi:hypothetical protein
MKMNLDALLFGAIHASKSRSYPPTSRSEPPHSGVLPLGAVETLDTIARREGASRSALCRTCEALERLALNERET